MDSDLLTIRCSRRCVVTLVIIALFPLVAGYIVLVERKVLADFQVRLGPMRVGPHGLLQPHRRRPEAAAEGRHHSRPIPTRRSSGSRPCISTFTALTAFAVLPFSQVHLRGRCECRPAGHLGDVGGGHSGNHSGRLGFQQPLSAAGRAAQRGATGELRSGAVASRCSPA